MDGLELVIYIALAASIIKSVVVAIAAVILIRREHG